MQQIHGDEFALQWRVRDSAGRLHMNTLTYKKGTTKIYFDGQIIVDVDLPEGKLNAKWGSADLATFSEALGAEEIQRMFQLSEVEEARRRSTDVKK
jgi:hypothetical protein